MGQRVGAPREAEGWVEEHPKVETPREVVSEQGDSQGFETLHSL